MKFIIISAVYNMADELKANIEILKQQDYTNFEVYFGDDLSTDNSCEVIEENIKDDKRFHLIKHQNKLFSMGNICTCIKAANPEDEDVIVLVDGDDKLSSVDVLSYLKEVYTKQQCLMTYGSYQSDGVKDKNCKPYPKIAAYFNLFRFCKWRASHLKTFKYKLWNKIDRTDLTITRKCYEKTIKNALHRGQLITWSNLRKVQYEDIVTSTYEYVRRCDDKTFTLPMLEMAGSRSYHISRVLYDYNRRGPHDFGCSDKKWAQRFIRKTVFLKPRYKKLDFN